MPIQTKIPTQLRNFVGGKSEISIEGVASIRELIDKLRGDYPELIERIVDEGGEIRRFVNVYVGDEDVRFLDGLDTPLEGDSSVSILPAVAGG